MGRYLSIIGIWMAGFALGFIGYLAYPALSQMIITILPFLMRIDSQVLGALVAGMASSFVTVLVVSVWAYASKPRSI